MVGHLTHVTIYVKDQDAALAFYTDVLGWAKTYDDSSMPGMRWLNVTPPNGQCTVVLWPEGPGPMGVSTAGGWSGMILHCDDIDATYADLKAKGVSISKEPTDRPWGRDIVFSDIDGNMFNLVQPKTMAG